MQANKGPSSAWGMLNYMLAFNQEKDSFTVLAHDLQRQYSQKNNRRNHQLIKWLMEIRHFILSLISQI